jgi:hypothetical protein
MKRLLVENAGECEETKSVQVHHINQDLNHFVCLSGVGISNCCHKPEGD